MTKRAKPNMRVIGPSKDTLPERRVRMLLVSRGIRHTRNEPRLPGKPDFYIEAMNLAVFVNGRFWHDPRRSGMKGMSAFWKAKLKANVARDTRNRKRLQRMGVRYLTLWCDEIAKRRSGWTRLLNRIEVRRDPK